MKQGEGTIQTIISTLAARDVEYELDGPITIAEVLTEADKKSVREQLFTMFREKTLTFKDEATTLKHEDDKELKKYVSGLLNNWIRKHKPFNCGVKYEAKNPGSRAHSSDEQMRELKKLLAQVTPTGDADAIQEVNEAIELRKTEIKPKTAVKPINVDALPEHLRSLVTSSN